LTVEGWKFECRFEAVVLDKDGFAKIKVELLLQLQKKEYDKKR
jgi:hypothetical protein